jgi:DNA polymerase-1
VAGPGAGARVALAVAPGGGGNGAPPLAAVVGDGIRLVAPLGEAALAMARLEDERSPRWTWWSAAHDASPLVAAGVRPARCWDVAEAHRLLHGGWEASPHTAWAAAAGLDAGRAPQPSRGDLFDFAAGLPGSGDDPEAAVRGDGYLRADLPGDGAALTGSAPLLLAWAEAALACADRQERQLQAVSLRALATAHAESSAALLCVELEQDGLPVDRPALESLIAQAAGPRPADEAHARALRAERDARVLAHTPGRDSTDLRNPLQVRELLAAVGVVVPSTRKWVLEPFRDTHPVVPALLAWRKEERIATTYGYGWLDAHVGEDDRLRGRWTACDGGAGRMTAQNGLHNLPAALRPGVAAQPGHIFVRADLGQIEPRVLAAVSGDERFATATRADDLYAPVARELGVERPVAKIAVLAAMYGQRSGPAGEALKRLERAYPTAMAYLDQAYAAGVRGEPLRTFGGRLVRTGGGPVQSAGEEGDGPEAPDAARRRDGARGRYARNAVVQGAAAELFKAWAATVRATTRDLGAQVVLCLHDELLLHVPEPAAEEAQARLVQALDDSARRWTGSSQVRFVADVSVVRRWSDAKA